MLVAPTAPLRVVLVDSRVLRRELMRQMVDGDGQRTCVVGEAGSADAAPAVVEEHAADVVLMDIGMPVDEGIRTIRALHARFPAVGIVVCSFDVDKATALDALAEGAHACLPKPASRSALTQALEDAWATAGQAASPIAARDTPSAI